MNTVFDAFAQTAQAHPDNAFLCVPARAQRSYYPNGYELSYGSAYTQVQQLAQKYRAAGWGSGHRVALALENHPAHFLHFLALNAIGASQVPVNPYYLQHELKYLLQHSEADLAVALPSSVQNLKAAHNLPIVQWQAEYDQVGFDAFTVPEAAHRQVDQTTMALYSEIALIYTSGTTAKPKGCVLDNNYALSVGQWYRDLGGQLTLRHGADRVFVPLPVFHVNGGINTPTAMILTANCLIMPDRFHASSWWQDLATTRATAMHYLGVIPPVLLAVTPAPTDRQHKLRFGLGAGLDPAIHQAFEERFNIPMVEVWGMTETGRFLADCHEPRAITTRAFGRPLPPLQARVVDAEDNDVANGVAGELLVRASHKNPRHGFFKAYLKDPQATENAWRGEWFHTGDVVVRDDTDMLYFVERQKNIIRRSGENISAAEVENALIEHPAVSKVAVLACEDELRDEEVFACIELNNLKDPIDARALLQFASTRLAYYKLPAWVAFISELPLTGTQKIQKHLLFPNSTDPRQSPAAIDLRSFKASLKPTHKS